MLSPLIDKTCFSPTEMNIYNGKNDMHLHKLVSQTF